MAKQGYSAPSAQSWQLAMASESLGDDNEHMGPPKVAIRFAEQVRILAGCGRNVRLQPSPVLQCC